MLLPATFDNEFTKIDTTLHFCLKYGLKYMKHIEHWLSLERLHAENIFQRDTYIHKGILHIYLYICTIYIYVQWWVLWEKMFSTLPWLQSKSSNVLQDLIVSKTFVIMLLLNSIEWSCLKKKFLIFFMCFFCDMLDIINRCVAECSHLQPGLSAEIFELCVWGDLATLPAQWVNSTDVW